MITINEYYTPFDKAIKQLNILLGKILFAVRDMSEDEIMLHGFDFNGYVKSIEDNIVSLEKKKYRYRFDRMNEAEFEMVLRRDSEGNLTVALDYQIKQYDTLRSISLEFDVNETTILNYNGMTLQDFWDKRERNEIIKIPKYLKQADRTIYENLAVYDSHSGKSAWGKDLDNNLTVVNGKLKILSHEETLKQGLLNMMDEYGAIPFFEEYTFDPDWGRDYPKDFLELFTKIKMERRLSLDPRVQEVIDISSQQVESGLKFVVKLYPINVIPKPENEKEIIL